MNRPTGLPLSAVEDAFGVLRRAVASESCPTRRAEGLVLVADGLELVSLPGWSWRVSEFLDDVADYVGDGHVRKRRRRGVVFVDEGPGEVAQFLREKEVCRAKERDAVREDVRRVERGIESGCRDAPEAVKKAYAPRVPLPEPKAEVEASPSSSSSSPFPDPDAAIAAAAVLADRPASLSLQRGLNVDVALPRPGLPDIPPCCAFVSAMCRLRADPGKTMAFLDGENGENGIVNRFRKARVAFLRSEHGRRSSSSLSGSAFVDGRYFARQVYLPLIEAVMAEIVAVGETVPLEMLSREVMVTVDECRRVMLAGGMCEIKKIVEDEAEAESREVQESVRVAKTQHVLSLNLGAALSQAQVKKVRDAASGSKHNMKRKLLYDRTRLRLERVLYTRRELHDGYYAWLLGRSAQQSSRLAVGQLACAASA